MVGPQVAWCGEERVGRWKPVRTFATITFHDGTQIKGTRLAYGHITREGSRGKFTLNLAEVSRIYFR